ncbi:MULTISPECIES: LysR family transcriptional regulator [Streptomyces]|uniref:LysR family transcriptional regulator n=1 Tax=Streptomyces TaxID=1883 RepID=UPI0004CA88DD|nr:MULTISPECIES: LysR family transcriptional regulator [Streptomyces]MDX3610032.1 LysR family transcriptional regulator [Streptomyces sp. FL06-04B]MDX3737915.1 LysR family transcriptional regulator [Streptomyces sp. ID01-15D]
MQIELRWLRYVVAVVDEGGMQRAAAALHMTQPPLSRQIRELERRLGTPLFTRRPLSLTPAGAVFVAHAREVLSSVDELVVATRATSTGEVGELAVGYILSGAYDTIPRLREAAEAAFPGMRHDFRELWPAQLDADLLNGELDLVIAHTMPARSEFRREALRTDPLVAVTRPSNAATSSGGPVMLGEAFDRQTFVFYDPKYAPEHYALLAKALDAGGGSHHVRLDMTPGLRNIALPDDYSFTLIPESMAPFLPRTVREVPLDTSNLPALDVELVWHRERESPVLLKFLTIAREVSADHGWLPAPRP